MKVSIVDSFTEPLAVMVSGNPAACGMIQRAMDAGNFISVNNGEYTIRPKFRQALLNKAVKDFSQEELRNLALLAGGFYDANNQDNKALELYAKYNESTRIKVLLLNNARKVPESGYYIEMRRYYLMLSDEDIGKNVYLMSAMSMLY